MCAWLGMKHQNTEEEIAPNGIEIGDTPAVGAHCNSQ